MSSSFDGWDKNVLDALWKEAADIFSARRPEPGKSCRAMISEDRVVVIRDGPLMLVVREKSFCCEDRVLCASLSPQGDLAAGGCSDGSVELWSVERGERIAQLHGHSGAVYSVAFSPKGDLLATGGEDRRTGLWSIPSLERVAVLEGHEGSIYALSFSTDGGQLATASDDLTASVWDVAERVRRRVLSGHGGWVTSVAFSPDGQRLATGSSDHSILLWDLVTGSPVLSLQGHNDSVSCVAFGPAGSGFVASGSADRALRLWNAQTGEQMARLVGHADSVVAVAVRPGGRHVATAGRDGVARVWNVGTGKCEASLEGHADSVKSVVFSRDGSRILTASKDATMVMWVVTTGEPVATLEGLGGALTLATLSAEETFVAACGAASAVAVWEVRGSTLVCVCKQPMGLAASMGPVRSVAPLSKGRALVTTFTNGWSALWSVPEGDLMDLRAPVDCTELVLDADSLTLALDSLSARSNGVLLSSMGGLSSLSLSGSGRLSAAVAALLLGLLRNAPLLVLRMGSLEPCEDGALWSQLRPLLAGRVAVVQMKDPSCRQGNVQRVDLSGWGLTGLDMRDILRQMIPIADVVKMMVDLQFSGNAVEFLPGNIGQATFLVSLDVSRNPLQSVPTTLSELRDTLQSLRVDVKKAGWLGGRTEVRTEELDGEGLRRALVGGGLERIGLPKVKVFLVGRVNAGKTTLVRALTGALAPGDLDQRAATVGVEQSSFPFRDFKIHLLDFAGHHEYLASHEVHLRATVAVVVVVVNLSEPRFRNHLRYWLFRLMDFRSADRSEPSWSGRPLIVVGTHRRDCDPGGARTSDGKAVVVDDGWFQGEVEAVMRETRLAGLPSSMAGAAFTIDFASPGGFGREVEMIGRAVWSAARLLRENHPLPSASRSFLSEWEGLKEVRARHKVSEPEMVGGLPLSQFVHEVRECVASPARMIGKLDLFVYTPASQLCSLFEACDAVVMLRLPSEPEDRVILSPSRFRSAVLPHFFRDYRADTSAAREFASFGPVVCAADYDEQAKAFPELQAFPALEFLAGEGLCLSVDPSGQRFLFPSLFPSDYVESPPISYDSVSRVFGRLYSAGEGVPETLLVRFQVEFLRQFPPTDESAVGSRVRDCGLWFEDRSGWIVDVCHHRMQTNCGIEVTVWERKAVPASVPDPFGVFDLIDRTLRTAAANPAFSVGLSKRLTWKVLSRAQLLSRLRIGMVSIESFSIDVLDVLSATQSLIPLSGDLPRDLLEGQRPPKS